VGDTATQEEAAVAYDMAAIEHRGLNAVTNFDISHYVNHWHRHCHGPCDDSLGVMDVVPFQLPDDLPECPAAIGVEETTGDAEFHSGEGYDLQHHTSGPLGAQAQQRPDEMGAPAAHQMAPKSSALNMVLQSPKFKELMEQVSAEAAASESSGGGSMSSSSPSPSLSSFSPPSPLQLPSPWPPQQQQPEFVEGAPPARCSFPEDVQTFFDFENENDMSFVYAEVDTFLFGDLGAYAAPIFHFDLDV